MKHFIKKILTPEKILTAKCRQMLNACTENAKRAGRDANL